LNSKDLITGKLNEAKAMLEAEDEEFTAPGAEMSDPMKMGPGGPRMRQSGPGRPMRPGGPGGPPGMFNPRERDAFKAIVMYELLNMAGRDQYYLNLVKTAISGKDPDTGQIQHLLDEAGRISDLLDENQRALLDKLSRMPQK
jgi:hypothetical protein